MNKFLLTASIVLALLLLGLSAKSQTNELDGTWVLKSVELYKHSADNDSTKVDNSYLAPNYISGAFDTISFEGNMTTVVIFGDTVRAAFKHENNIISLYVSSIPMEYNLIEKGENLVLIRRYGYTYNSDEYVQYSMKLSYKK